VHASCCLPCAEACTDVLGCRPDKVDAPTANIDAPPQAKRNGVTAAELFEFFDANADGDIDLAEFTSGLERLCIYGTKAELAAVLVRFSAVS